MFETLKTLNADPILGLMAEFRNDPREQKIDLGVGIYRDQRGNTPIMKSVAEAEKKTYRNRNYESIHRPSGFRVIQSVN